MNREQLEHAIRAAGAVSGDRELYVVGSQCILGPFPQAHADLCRSMEVDIAPKNFPERETLIEGSIGELSPFHETFGFCVDGVDMRTIVLPTNWQERVVVIDNSNTNGFRGLCLDPADLVVSKLVAGRPKDLRYIQVLIRETMVTPTVVERRLAETPSLEAAHVEELRTRLRRLQRE